MERTIVKWAYTVEEMQHCNARVLTHTVYARVCVYGSCCIVSYCIPLFSSAHPWFLSLPTIIYNETDCSFYKPLIFRTVLLTICSEVTFCFVRWQTHSFRYLHCIRAFSDVRHFSLFVHCQRILLNIICTTDNNRMWVIRSYWAQLPRSIPISMVMFFIRCEMKLKNSLFFIDRCTDWLYIIHISYLIWSCVTRCE